MDSDTEMNTAAAAASTSAVSAVSASSSSTPASSTAGRVDGRTCSELRAISVEAGLLSRADGSAQWSSTGGSSVLAAVYGPTLATGREEKPDRATVVVNFKAESGSANNVDIERGSYIRQCLEPLLVLTAHPRCKIVIQLQVLRDGGSLLAAALNAAMMALVDAGVQCTAILAAVSIAIREKDSKAKASAAASKDAAANFSQTVDFLLDPTEGEENTLPVATFAFASTSAGVLLSVIERGALDETTYFEALQMGRAAAAHVQQFQKISLEKRTTSSTSSA